MKQLLVCFLLLHQISFAQIVINEGCNKNYLTTSDENGDASDWIELHNAGTTQVNLNGYSLSDKLTVPGMWILPNLTIPAGGFQQIFCSQKNRFGSAPFQFGLSEQNYTPQAGWSQHQLVTPFYWDGVSNVMDYTRLFEFAKYKLEPC